MYKIMIYSSYNEAILQKPWCFTNVELTCDFPQPQFQSQPLCFFLKKINVILFKTKSNQK